MKSRKKKKQFLSNLERFLYKFFALVIVFLIIGIVCSETSLAQMNLDVQKLDVEVEKQRKRIESLKMKIDEMTSLDNLKEISDQYGLDYHSENIKTVE